MKNKVVVHLCTAARLSFNLRTCPWSVEQKKNDNHKSTIIVLFFWSSTALVNIKKMLYDMSCKLMLKNYFHVPQKNK